MEKKTVVFREISDLGSFDIYSVDVVVLSGCPFCGGYGRLNHSPIGWYGWCGSCGAEGPKNSDWRKASVMWNDRK